MAAPQPVFTDLCTCNAVHYSTCVANNLSLKDITFVSHHTHLHKVSFFFDTPSHIHFLHIQLSISDNQITSLKPLDALEQLIYLLANSNNITTLDFTPFILEVLNVSHNKLTRVVNFQAKFLTELDLSYNHISLLDGLTLPHLRFMNISNNSLTSLAFVPSLRELRVLNVVCFYFSVSVPLINSSVP